MVGVIASTATVAFITALSAQAAKFVDTQQSFSSLIASGFEVVATTFIPREAQPNNKPVILVTLQQEKRVAVCSFSPPAWQNMVQEELNNPSQCEIRQGYWSQNPSTP